MSTSILDSSLVLTSLNEQRKNNSSGHFFTDVVLKCGPLTTPAHSSVLCSVSGVFANILTSVKENMTQDSLSIIQLEVDALFVGLEHHFLDIVDTFYGAPCKFDSPLLQTILLKFDLKCLRGEAIPTPAPNLTKSSAELSPLLPPQENQQSVEISTTSSAKEKPPSAGHEVKMDVSFCIKCDLLFISQEEYLAHRMLNCTRKFTCKSCGSMFSRVQNLLEHLADIRHGETICSLCQETCRSSNEMEEHIQKHLQERDKPFFCLQCDSRFSSRYALSHHVPKHSLETPYVCQICTRGFKWKHALTSHMVTHSSHKKFLCQNCGFATSHSSVFKSHQRMHSGQLFKCTFPGCTFQTIRKSNLIQHQLTHSKEKPHQCDVCGKSFSLVKNLRRHMNHHDFSARRLVCQLEKCQFSTLRKDKYMDHLRKAHPTTDDVMKPTSSLNPSPFETINPPNKNIISPDNFMEDVKNSEVDANHSLNVLLGDFDLSGENLILRHWWPKNIENMTLDCQILLLLF